MFGSVRGGSDPASIWEGSRMLLPEHREALVAHFLRRGAEAPPKPDREKLAEVEERLRRALATGREVVLTAYTPQGDVRFAGRPLGWRERPRGSGGRPGPCVLVRKEGGEEVELPLAYVRWVEEVE
ncbi:MAG: YolD-like family protein [Brockia lithotrophica]|nr:hypothetical protein [Brockia lithotrophica]MBT9253295.1 YolD-like family protein [Brockia lithotrophica]